MIRLIIGGVGVRNIVFWMLAIPLSILPLSSAIAQKGKPIVAIYQMDDLANSGQAATFSTMIETAIASTSKFRVIERERLKTLIKEQGGAKGGLLTTNRPGKIGGFEGADFLIYGSITTVTVVHKSDFGSSLLRNMMSRQGSDNVNCGSAIATLGIDIKITDADSGEVKYVTRISETQKGAAVCGQAGEVNTSLLLRAAADKVATGLVTTIYPIQIAAAQSDGVFVLNYGEGAVQAGTIMGVYTKGAVILDPATGEVLANDEKNIGFIKITDVIGRISKAVAVSPFSGSVAIGSIVRPANAGELQTLSKAGKRR